VAGRKAPCGRVETCGGGVGVLAELQAEARQHNRPAKTGPKNNLDRPHSSPGTGRGNGRKERPRTKTLRPWPRSAGDAARGSHSVLLFGSRLVSASAAVSAEGIPSCRLPCRTKAEFQEPSQRLPWRLNRVILA